MRLLIIGFGTVGQGLAELLVATRDTLRSRYGLDAKVTGIADTLKGSCFDASGIDLEDALARVEAGESLSTSMRGGCDWDAPTMIERADGDVMLEATYTDIETAEPATSHIRAALTRGLHVATTNKGPLALHHRELSHLARQRGVHFLFEGTVMAGTPLLNMVRESLAGCQIIQMQGILNGTTNYILTRMESGMDYTTALAEAQELGYAEAVPDADVLGWDALAKVTILANVVFDASLKPGDSPCEGITKVTPEDIAAASRNCQHYKLIGTVWREGGTVRAAVGPQLIPAHHPLAAVAGASNAITITTDALGEVTVVGPGAGRSQTGFALLNDMLTIWRHS